MAQLRPRISKSRFMAGLQCHKLLWWRVHEPDAPELVPGPGQQAVFDQGTRVGEVARTYVPGGTLIDLPHDAFERRLARTREVLAEGAPVVYEASFRAGSLYAALDILERVRQGFRIIEVKSATRIKDEHLPDVAIQAHLLRECGFEVAGIEIMHLDRACRFPDLGNLFVRSDVTAAVEPLLSELPAQVEHQLRVLAGPCPDVPIGAQCTTPYACPFLERCWPKRPEHHVSTLYHAGGRASEFEAAGYATIDQLPGGLGLRPPAERQRRAVRAGEMIVEPGLARALGALRSPLAFLDFETVAPAIPCWEDCRPYDAVPVQFSCHRENPGAEPSHHEWLAEGPEDPRPELARRLIEACHGARTIVAYNAGFERTCLRAMAAVLPEQRAALEDLEARLADALPILRDHIYHPAFGGSFSLKSVLPALVPELSYEGLEIAEGNRASVELARLLFEEATLAPGERTRLRAALLRYCALDTLALVRLVERMRALAG